RPRESSAERPCREPGWLQLEPTLAPELHQTSTASNCFCPHMKVVSVSVGLPREIQWKGKPIRTSIFKTPVTGRIPVTKLNLNGDQQSDLSVHGGIDKAVYAYPSEHYAFWREQLSGVDLPWGVFGENFTTEGLDEGTHIGDRFRIGSAEFAVT